MVYNVATTHDQPSNDTHFTMVTPQIIISVYMEEFDLALVRTYLIYTNMFLFFLMACLQACKRSIIATAKTQSLPLS